MRKGHGCIIAHRHTKLQRQSHTHKSTYLGNSVHVSEGAGHAVVGGKMIEANLNSTWENDRAPNLDRVLLR